jgi:hypothetical protein
MFSTWRHIMTIRRFTLPNRLTFWLSLFLLTATFVHQAKAQQAIVATPCDKYLPASTVSGLLVGKPAINRYSMSGNAAGEGCEWGVSDTQSNFAMVDFAILRGLKMSFADLVTLNGDGKPLPGVGDRAEQFATTNSNIPNAKETDVMAQKGDRTCYAQLHRTNGAPGEKLTVTQDDQAVAAQLGKLCSIGFSAGP